MVETKADGDITERVRIAIKRDALGREFLLQSGLTQMPYLGTSFGNLSRIVLFKVIDGSLWMFEATDGNIVTDDIPQTFVLAKFPIVRQTRDAIVFDFNAGMSDLLVGEEWRASDFTGRDPKYASTAVKTRLSYLADAKIAGTNELVIRQIAQVDMPQGALDPMLNLRITQDHGTVEMKYYLTPYAPDPNFVPMQTTDFNQVGYFEVAPRFDAKGNALTHVTKFGEGDITFSISNNVPAEFKQAVVDGVLYWNKILGDRVKVIDAPEDVNAPDFNHNVVQWIEWDSAGFAYADAQMDPRTGETLHAQVYMTSVFAVFGIQDARDWLDRLDIDDAQDGDAADGDTDGLSRRIGLSGFSKGHLCSYDLTAKWKQLMTRAVEMEMSDAQVMKVAQDTVREVVAHEIGHTLGLRHNFAGSLAANFPLSDLETVFKQYVTDGRAPADKVTTSSVMEYQTFLNSAITGDQLVTRPTALSYDDLAIGHLYLDKELVPADGESTLPLFCTDSHESVFIDCKVFDDGISIPASIARTVASSQRYLTEFGEVLYQFPSDMAASILLGGTGEALPLVLDSTRLIAVRRTTTLAPGLEPQIRQAELDKLAAELEAAGGFAAVLPLELPLPSTRDPDMAPAKLNLETALMDTLATLFAGIPSGTVVDHPISTKFAEHLSTFVGNVTLAETDAPLTVEVPAQGEAAATTLTLPTFKFNAALRAKAASALAPGKGVAVDFALAEQLTQLGALRTKLNTALGQDIETADLTLLPAAARRWVLENRKVLAAFN